MIEFSDFLFANNVVYCATTQTKAAGASRDRRYGLLLCQEDSESKRFFAGMCVGHVS